MIHYIMGKYQMIKPYTSDKLYESTDVNKCAKKFYNILKQNGGNHAYFVLKNIDDNTCYHFATRDHKLVGG